MNYLNEDMSEEDFALCKMQGELFSMAYKDEEVSTTLFIRSFMKGKLVKMFDNHSILFSSMSIDDVYKETKKNLKKRTYKPSVYSESCIYWVGYMYRYWAASTGLPSSHIYKLMKVNELASVYPSYHTQDTSKAFNMIIANTKPLKIMTLYDSYRQNKK